MDLKVGLICKETGKIADFENECPSYQLDEKHAAQLDNEDAIEPHQIVGRLSKKNLEKLKEEQMRKI